jgi:hypothetical protein
VSTEAWLGILSGVVFAVLGVAVVWGGLKNEVGNLRTEIIGLKSSRDKQGERCGDLERAMDKLDGRLALVRQATQARGVPLQPIDFPRED